jgi:peroxin-6
LASTEGVDKRYERAWLTGVREHFVPSPQPSGIGADEPIHKLVKRGDIFSVPVWPEAPLNTERADNGDEAEVDDAGSEEDEDEDEDHLQTSRKPTGLVYFKVSAINYDPLVALEEDFRSSVASKARAGELGCWVDVGKEGSTQMTLDGLEREMVSGRSGDRAWHRTRKH